MSQKLVSIIMPAFNNATTIGPAIESVLAQTYPHWELLIVDDAPAQVKLLNFCSAVRMGISIFNKNKGVTTAARGFVLVRVAGAVS